MTDAAGIDREWRGSRGFFVAQGLAVALVAALLGLLVWKLAHEGSGAGLVAAIERGETPPAPAFALPVIWNRSEFWPHRARAALADNRIALSELAGIPVVLNFWASWCIPCKEEAPALAAAAKRHRGEVAFLGLDIQDFTQDARRFLTQLDVPYPSVRDGSSASYSAYGLTGVPETFYIDGEGRIVGHSVGAVSERELKTEIASLTGETR